MDIILFINHQNTITMRLLVFLTTLCFITTLHAQTGDRSTLMMKEGFFAPTFYIDGEKTIKDEFVSKINLDPTAAQQFKKGTTIRGVGNVIGTIGAIPFGAEIGRRLASAQTDTDVTHTSINNLSLYGGGALFIVGTAIYYSGRASQKLGIETYNKGGKTTSLGIGLTAHGVGFALTF